MVVGWRRYIFGYWHYVVSHSHTILILGKDNRNSHKMDFLEGW